MKKPTEKTIKHAALAAAFSVSIFLFFGIVTALISTSLFVRMIAANVLDYVFLFLTSVMLGSYISLHLYQKNIQGGYRAVGGGVGGIFAFGCPICNKLVILALGVSGALAFFEPLRFYIGIVSVMILGFALYSKVNYMKCKKC